MARNITLTIDEDLVREARKVALDRNTSVNNLVRGFLESLVAQSGAQRLALAQMEELFRAKPFRIGTKDWSREDLYERHLHEPQA